MPPTLLLALHLSDGHWLPARVERIALTLFAAFLPVAATYHQITQSYRDRSPRECTARLTHPPLTGLYTSPRRAELIDSMAPLIARERFVFAFHRLPGLFYFGETRSSLDSINGDLDFPIAIAERSLRHMAQAERWPTLVVREKDHHWNWGLEKPHWIGYPARHPFTRFTECARAETLFDTPEVEIYRVQSPKLADCLRESLSPAVAFH